MRITDNPMRFAENWYKVADIHRSINTHNGLGVRVDIPEDQKSIAFAQFLAEQYRLAMAKGATLAIEELRKGGE